MEDFIRQFTGTRSAGNGDPCGVGDQKSDLRSDKPEVVSHSAYPGASGFTSVFKRLPSLITDRPSDAGRGSCCHCQLWRCLKTGSRFQAR
jgi:hypothetical protein